MYKKQKIAVLISGPLRTFFSVWPKNQYILESLGYDLEYYLHTWDKNLPTHRVLLNNKSDKYIWNMFKPTKLNQIEGQSIKYSDFRDFNWKIIIENHEIYKSSIAHHIPKDTSNPQSYYNTMSMYYGMTKIARHFELSGNPVHYFLRLRPDFLLPRNFSINTHVAVKMHGNGVTIKGKLISDQCFSGLYPRGFVSMLGYDSLLKKISNEGWLNQDLNVPRVGEVVLYEHLLESKILDSTINGRFERKGVIIRGELIKDPDKSKIKFAKEALGFNLNLMRKKSFRLFHFLYHTLKLFLKLSGKRN